MRMCAQLLDGSFPQLGCPDLAMWGRQPVHSSDDSEPSGTPLPDKQGRSPQSPADGATDPDPSASSSPAVHQMVEQITAAALRGVAQELLQHFPL